MSNHRSHRRFWLLATAATALLFAISSDSARADGPVRVIRRADPRAGLIPGQLTLANGVPVPIAGRPGPGAGRPGAGGVIHGQPIPVAGRPGPGGRPTRPPGARPRPFPPRRGAPLPPRPRTPGLVRAPVIVVGARIPGRLYTPPPSRDDDEDDIEATRVISRVISGRACERAGDVLREMANVLMNSAEFVSAPQRGRGPRDVIVRPGESGDLARRRWAEHLHSARFWQVIWGRLATMYRECNRGCFDDGVAIGQISATGYCAASVGVGGLDAPGFEEQKPMPMCETATFNGCVLGYDQGAAAFEGCSLYTSGGYTDIFNESKSQDCHMD